MDRGGRLLPVPPVSPRRHYLGRALPTVVAVVLVAAALAARPAVAGTSTNSDSGPTTTLLNVHRQRHTPAPSPVPTVWPVEDATWWWPRTEAPQVTDAPPTTTPTPTPTPRGWWHWGNHWPNASYGNNTSGDGSMSDYPPIMTALNAMTGMRHADIFIQTEAYNITSQIIRFNFALTGACMVDVDQPFNIYPNIAFFVSDEAFAAGCTSFGHVIQNNDLVVYPGLYLFTQPSVMNALPGFADLIGHQLVYQKYNVPVTIMFPGDEDRLFSLLSDAGHGGVVATVTNDPGPFITAPATPSYIILQTAHFFSYGSLFLISMATVVKRVMSRRSFFANRYAAALQILGIIFCAVRIVEAVDMLGFADIYGIGPRYGILWGSYLIGFVMVCVYVGKWMYILKSAFRTLSHWHTTSGSSSVSVTHQTKISSDRSKATPVNNIFLIPRSIKVYQVVAIAAVFIYLVCAAFIVLFYFRLALDKLTKASTYCFYIMGAQISLFAIYVLIMCVSILHEIQNRTSLKEPVANSLQKALREYTYTVIAVVMLLMVILLLSAIEACIQFTPMNVIITAWFEMVTSLLLIGIIQASIYFGLTDLRPSRMLNSSLQLLSRPVFPTNSLGNSDGTFRFNMVPSTTSLISKHLTDKSSGPTSPEFPSS